MDEQARDRQDALLSQFADAVRSDELRGRGAEFLSEASALVGAFLATAESPLASDPFTGGDPEAPAEPNAYYTMFWRMFDRTPAAMLQEFAMEVRRTLARRIFKRVGEGVIFHHNVLFSRGENIELGDGVLVNRYAMLDDRASLVVGDHTMLAAGITIETHTHPFDDFSKPIAYGGRSGRPVAIGRNSVVGYNAVVMAGVTLGERCIVAANSVVTKDVPDYTVVGGVPAQPIKQYLPPDADESADR
jgi:acetyltransferase-like isoleucine patch superfamily enzyme